MLNSETGSGYRPLQFIKDYKKLKRKGSIFYHFLPTVSDDISGLLGAGAGAGAGAERNIYGSATLLLTQQNFRPEYFWL